LTSSERTKKRAEAGAGVPARKDFYDFRGTDFVPRFPINLPWKEFLRLTGSRARRRERCFCPRIRVSDIFEDIQKLVLHCLSVAESQRTAYTNPATRTAAINSTSDTVNWAIRKLLASIADKMRFVAEEEAQRVHGPGSGGTPTPCLTCPDPDKCRQIFAGPEPGSAQDA
jgi:hypothetical protein